MSDYSDLTAFIGSSPAQDVKFDDLGDFIEETDLSGIQQELIEDYKIYLTLEQVQNYIAELGIDVAFNDYRVCDIIYEHIESV